jgi:uncharacterized protein YihD (DUF1040 family)
MKVILLNQPLMKKIPIKEIRMLQVEPNSAKELLETIKKVWAKYPELRLTQLLVNVIKPSESCAEIYYTEDSKLIDLLNELVIDETEVAEVQANDIDELLMLHNEMLEFFGFQVDVDTWMHTKVTVLGGEKPISLLSTAEGRKTLKQLLNRMKHGDF